MIAVGRAAGVTDTGRRRLRNEDAFVCEPPLFAVADGMGGARAGEIAAELAATALEEGAGATRGTDALVELVQEANRRIWERSVADPQTAGMGAVATTFVAAVARAADVALAVDGESIPLAGFAQLTLIAGVLGIGIAALARRFARHARRAFVSVTVALTALSLVPDLTVDATTGSKLVLMLTHVVAAALIIPALARRLDA